MLQVRNDVRIGKFYWDHAAGAASLRIGRLQVRDKARDQLLAEEPLAGDDLALARGGGDDAAGEIGGGIGKRAARNGRRRQALEGDIGGGKLRTGGQIVAKDQHLRQFLRPGNRGDQRSDEQG